MSWEADQRRLLLRNRRIATVLLLGVAAVFVGASLVPRPDFWIRLVRATAEAGVVGALADWFAVTALFRRPMGLPIPHTAIIPHNKDRIGAGIAGFIERNFLTEELVLDEVRNFNPARRLAFWLQTPGTPEAVARRIVRTLPQLLLALDDRELRGFTVRALGDQLRTIRLAPLLGRVIAILTAKGYRDVAIDQALALCSDFLARNREQLEAIAAERRRWWVPKAIDRRIAEAILDGLAELLEKLRERDDKGRSRLRDALDGFIEELLTSPERHEQIENFKRGILESTEVQAWLASVWDAARNAGLAELRAQSPRMQNAVAAAVASLGLVLQSDPAISGRLNRAIEGAVSEALPWRKELVRFITGVVDKWDTQVCSDQIELALGADLQYVRITGTLVGACIGCSLFLLFSFFNPV